MNFSSENRNIDKRRATYGAVSSSLAFRSDQCLAALVSTATPIGASIGGTSALLEMENQKIFVKKIRITDIEKQPENWMSTRNIFDLPLYYQYGIGSTGFGVWRELAAHSMTTNWVLSGECKNFPIMYHWRLLPRPGLEQTTSEQLAELEREVAWWGGSSIVRRRLLANLNASADIVVFLEYFPENLHTWLRKQIFDTPNVAESACKMVESNLNAITSFMNSQGLLHFDAHFYNILTDGHDLYFSDFGLAIYEKFDLSEVELNFFKQNYNYDQCYTKAYFVEWLLAELFGIQNWVIGNANPILHEYATGKGRPLLPIIEEIIMRYAPIAVLLNQFFIELKECKLASYPTSELERICAAKEIN